MLGRFGIPLLPDVSFDVPDLEIENPLDEDDDVTPVCLVCNSGMFAIRVQPALPREKPCKYLDGFILGDIPKYNLAVRAKFVGIGVAWEDGPPGKQNIAYGTARNTRGDLPNSPTVYDGLAQINIQPPTDFDFWLSFNFNFVDLRKHKVSQHKKGMTEQMGMYLLRGSHFD